MSIDAFRVRRIVRVTDLIESREVRDSIVNHGTRRHPLYAFFLHLAGLFLARANSISSRTHSQRCSLSRAINCEFSTFVKPTAIKQASDARKRYDINWYGGEIYENAAAFAIA